jgi:pimeloyl-ACP methyl ester carboxylesterase
MPEVELTPGTVEYQDTGGDGPVLVLLHGLFMDGTVWRKVVAELRGEYRCILPTLPLGAHRRPMKPDADLSMPGLARLIGEFLERLDLRDVTLVFNDWNGAPAMAEQGLLDRVARLGLVACEAFDNYPPGVPGRIVDVVSRVPRGLGLAGALWLFASVPAVRRAPGGFGWLSKRPVPREVADGWFHSGSRGAQAGLIRRDLLKYTRSVPSHRELLSWTGRLADFPGRVLVVWAEEDRMMPHEHGPRLAALCKDARLVWVSDSYTLVPEDRPDALVTALREFVPRPGAGESAADERAAAPETD